VAAAAIVDENRELKRRLEDRFQYGSLVGKSRKMLALLDMVKSIAASDANVLVQALQQDEEAPHPGSQAAAHGRLMERAARPRVAAGPRSGKLS
jgi:hypothetical protein